MEAVPKAQVERKIFVSPKTVEMFMKKMVKEKKSRKSLSLEQKMSVIKRIENGERMKDIEVSLGLAHSTVCTIFANREKIKKSSESVAYPGKLLRVTRSRHEIFEKLEMYLIQWMEHQTDRGLPLSTLIIQQKAISMFQELKNAAVEKGVHEVSNLSFKASHGWFERFKKRAMLQNINITKEAASVDSAFPVHLLKTIGEGGYSAKQIFNLDETSLFWKRLPSRTFISQDEKRVPGPKASKDKLTLLLGGNCAGDVKLKPLLVYHSVTPRAMKGIQKDSLPVIWRSNHKAWVTQEVFSDYIQSYLSPFIKNYTEENNIENKALLILDNAPGYPFNIVDYGPNIQVVFLPPNTTALLQPMNQGVIATFKAYYLQLLMQYMVDAPDTYEEACLKEVWKCFDIRKAVELIDTAWQKMTPQTMNSAWAKLCPEFVTDFKGLDEMVDAKVMTLSLAKEAGFQEVDEDDVDELLQSHSGELTLDELEDFNKHRLCKQEEEEEKVEESEEEVTDEETEEGAAAAATNKTLDATKIEEIIDCADKMIHIVTEYDSDMVRSIAFKNAITSALIPFREVYKRKLREGMETSILQFFQPIDSTYTDMPKPSTSGAASNIKQEELS